MNINDDQLPSISLGSSKYPVTSLVNINFSPAKYGLEPSDGDLFAAFVGNECRGTVPPTIKNFTSGQIPLVVFGLKEGETVKVLYYNAKSNTVYDTDVTFLTARNEENFTLD